MGVYHGRMAVMYAEHMQAVTQTVYHPWHMQTDKSVK